jgi:ABC-type oligopeptide transport system substrate-binding subunit
MRPRAPWASCLAIGIAVAVTGCGDRADPAAPQKATSTLRRGLSGEPASFDPAAASDHFSTQVMQDLYEGLTTESPTGVAMPGVAASWTVDSTGREYRFNLRADARWSNGKPVRSQDFVVAWRRVVDPKNGSPGSDNLRIVDRAADIIAGKAPPSDLGVFAADDSTLIIKLRQPAPYLPELLTHSSTFPIYSETSAISHNPELWVSNGPYILKYWRPGTTIDLIKKRGILG